MNDLMIKVENVSKQYKLGQIGGTTLRDELQRRRAKRRGLEDPTRMIGARDYEDGETFLALDGVSFEVKPGERVGIIGHNGARKSTLLKLLSRVTAPTTGTIGLNGRITSMLEVGTGFHGELTGRENIYMNGAILGMTKKEIDSKIEDIIEFSEVRQFIDTPVKRYSSGMYVKLAFSVAAHLDSEIMIMDEVLAVGDMAFQKKCLDKMNDVSKTEGRTILYVSHNMNTIRQLCDRVIVLDHGHIVFDGGVEEGIAVYLGESSVGKLIYDYSSAERKGCLPQEQIKLLMRRLTIQGKNEACFQIGEPIRFVLHCYANRDCTGIGIRFEIFSSGSLVGTTFSDKYISAEKGSSIVIEMTLDTSFFVPSFYSMTLLTYEMNEYGMQTGLDRVEDALCFEMVDARGGLLWRHRDWGYVRLKDVNINSISSNENSCIE